jgi:tetratricopeptide (TPR) repeat protein
MSADNDRLLERIGAGDTLRALSLLQPESGNGDPRLALNRALYGAGGEEDEERIRAADQQHRAALSQAQGAERATLLYNLGCFALRQDDVVEARMRFGEVLELEPGHLMARHNLACAAELLAETEEARREYRAVLAQNPHAALSRLNLAQLALQDGEYEEGLEHLETLVTEQSGNMGVLLYLCRGLILRGSAADLERVLSLVGPGSEAERYVDLQECRAFALFQLGDLEDAEAAFQALLDSDADNAFALAGMIKLLGQRGDFDALHAYAERLHAVAPGDATAKLIQELESA